MTPLISRRVRVWLYVHRLLHGSTVVIRTPYHFRTISGPMNESAIVSCRSVGVAQCACGKTRVAYDRITLGFDGSRAAA